MLRRSYTALSLLLLAAAPLSAQMAGMKDHDPDKKADGGALPAGWAGRTDRDNAKLSDAKFVTMGSGYHITSGPAAIYWNSANRVTGPFTATATITQTKAPAGNQSRAAASSAAARMPRSAVPMAIIRRRTTRATRTRSRS